MCLIEGRNCCTSPNDGPKKIFVYCLLLRRRPTDRSVSIHARRGVEMWCCVVWITVGGWVSPVVVVVCCLLLGVDSSS